jgi:glucose-6-phosphate isomerase
MESNKSVGRDGNLLIPDWNYYLGEPELMRNMLFQLIHQGTKLIPSDFIGFVKPLYGDEEHHDKLMSNYFAQTEALMHGNSRRVQAEFDEQGLDSERAKFLLPFKVFAGNKSNTILIEKLTQHLGL